MKKKFITLKRYQEMIKPKERLSYSDKSPFNPITLPSCNGIFIAWHGPEALVVNGATGTAYVCRMDAKDSKLLNFDVYSIRRTENSEIIEIVVSSRQEYHWTDNVPDLMKESVPEWVEEKIIKIKNIPKDEI
jgi:hypothetical protein